MARPAREERITVDEYLRGEDGAFRKSEYVGGRVFGMVGASDAHNRIVMNLVLRFGPQAVRANCQPYASDMKVQVLPQVFYYPDFMVVCETLEDENYFKRFPCLIVEVLSPSTANVDRGEKLYNYTRIGALQTYVMVSQDKVLLEVYRRAVAGKWTYETLGEGDALALPCPEVTLSLADIYQNVPLRPGDEPFAPPRL